MKSAILVALTLLSAWFPPLQKGPGDSEGLGQLLAHPLSNLTSSPLSTDSAFQYVMLESRIAGGEAIVQGCAETPGTILRLHGSAPREALNSITTADPRFVWQIKDEVVDLLPAGGAPPLLTVPIAVFDSKDAADVTSAETLLFALPDVRNGATKLGLMRNGVGTGIYSIAPGPPPRRKPLDVHLHNVTVLDALNALVRSRKPGIWIYHETHCGGQNLFDIGFTQQGEAR